MNTIASFSRRDFLRLSGMTCSGLILGFSAKGDTSSSENLSPDIFLTLEPSGAIQIYAHRSEMGTGIRTVLPMVVADELGADWEDVDIKQATGDKKFGSQNTDGSRSIWKFFDRMRTAGATAGFLLNQAAAARWNVDPGTCQRNASHVIHKESGKRIAFKELVVEAAKLPLPEADELVFKSPAERTYIGKGKKVVDFADMVSGKAVFGADVRLPNMLFAVVERSPVLGATWKDFDEEAPLTVNGVSQVVTIAPFKAPHAFQALGGIAVLADHTYAAIKGREKLKTQWGTSEHDTYDSDGYRDELMATVEKEGVVVRQKGDYKEAVKGLKTHSASYYAPHLLHQPMEPPVATADFKDGRCIVWAPTQNPQAAQDVVATALKIPASQVTVHVTLLGGGFGRKSKPDYVAEAALLSQKVGRPVQVVWTREDDIQHDYFHSVAALKLEAGLDKNGYPEAWRMRTAFPSISSTFAKGVVQASAGEMGMGFSDLPFDVPNILCENGPASAHVRIGWLRSVANIQHAFAIHSFVDELAARAGIDPLTYLNRVIGRDRKIDLKAEGAEYSNYGAPIEKYPVDTARLKHVLNTAARSADWGRPLPAGQGQGIAVHRSFVSYIAIAVRVRVLGRKMWIEQVDLAIDCGLAVHPERIRSQMEGSVVFGISLAMMGKATMKKGAVEQSNFHDAPVARITDAKPKINVSLIQSDAPPGGVGEPGVPPFAPALCNALFAATGKRIRSLPINEYDLAEA